MGACKLCPLLLRFVLRSLTLSHAKPVLAGILIYPYKIAYLCQPIALARSGTRIPLPNTSNQKKNTTESTNTHCAIRKTYSLTWCSALICIRTYHATTILFHTLLHVYFIIDLSKYSRNAVVIWVLVRDQFRHRRLEAIRKTQTGTEPKNFKLCSLSHISRV